MGVRTRDSYLWRFVLLVNLLVYLLKHAVLYFQEPKQGLGLLFNTCK